MATLTLTFPVGSEAGATLRMLAKRLEEIAMDMPDRHSSGPSIVVTLDNAPATGTASVQVTAGPDFITNGIGGKGKKV